MSQRDPRVDEYIKAAAPFARPILRRIRSRFHKASSQMSETIKWGFPYFEKDGMVGGMAAFKAHVSIGFWNGDRLSDPRSVKAPADLLAALAKKPKARKTFEGFAYSHRKEYVSWIEEAKRPETRARRVAQAVEWMAEGKRRNWKYESC
jgi:hypothetical protein